MFLGEIETGKITLNPFGKLVKYTWNDLPNHNYHIGLDEFIIMQNHVYGIITIQNNNTVGAGSEPVPTSKSQR